MGEFNSTDRVSPVASLVTSGANSASFQPGKPINVKRIIIVVDTAATTIAATMTYGVRNADGTTAVNGGTFTLPISALNAVLKADVAGVKTANTIFDTWGISQPAATTTGRVNGVQTNLPGELKVNVGQEVFVTSSGPGGAGTVGVYFEYQEEGNAATRFNPTDMVVTFA